VDHADPFGEVAPVKIGYLTTSLIPSVAANSVQVMKMSQAFGRLGHDVTLYACRSS
jgi:hypothetical protein